jgi:5-enolpyruvylshikimate-3-phosphate synthase
VVKDSSDRIAKVINQLSRLGVNVTKTKSRLDLFQALQGYKDIRGFVKL